MNIYVADHVLIKDGLFGNREEVMTVINFWKDVEDNPSKPVYITSTGLEIISNQLRETPEGVDNFDFLIGQIKSCFNVIDISSTILEEAKKNTSDDLESAIEIVCAKSNEYILITNRPQHFNLLNGSSSVKIIEPENFLSCIEPAYSKEEIVNDFSRMIPDCISQYFETYSIKYDEKSPDERNNKAFEPGISIVKSALQSCLAFSKIITRDFNSLRLHLYFSTLAYPSEILIRFLPSFRYSLSARKLRAIDEYIDLTRQYGGEDWGYYAEKYDVIEAEWENLQTVLEDCSQLANVSYEYYCKFEELWNNLNKFCDLYSHQEERIKWLNKLISLSFKYNAWNNYFRTLTRSAWTLIMKNDLEEAEKKILLAKSKLNSIKDTLLLVRFYHCYTNFCIQRYRIEDTTRISDIHFGLIRRLRLEIGDTLTYHREYTNWRGDAAKNTSKGMDKHDSQYVRILFKCLEDFTECLRISEDTNWLRGISYYHNKIADIKITLAENSDIFNREKFIREAKESIVTATNISELNKNRRRLAALLLTGAKLDLLDDCPKEAIKKAEEGIELCNEIKEPDTKLRKNLVSLIP
jgi:hypothetical protein